MRSRHLLDSLHYAVEGIVHTLHVDWHLRYIALAGAVVLMVSVFASCTRVEMLLLALATTLVIMAELFNRAMEAVVDLLSPEYHASAKVAKDVAAAGVLMAVVCGLLVVAGVFVRAETLDALRGVGDRPGPHFLQVAVVGIITVVVAVLLAKLWQGHWNLARGGMISAHSALAFFCFISVCFLTEDVLVWGLALVPALLVAQARVEAGIHSVREVLIGAAVALAAGGLLYGVLPMRGGG